MGVCALNKLLGFNLGYSEIMYCYSFIRTKTGASYLQIRQNRNYLITDLPDSSSGKEKHFVKISGPLINPESTFTVSFPVGFGYKASKKINRGCSLSKERKKLVHQVWQFSGRSAHLLLQYTPRYKSFICQHKVDLPLSPTESSTDPEKEKEPLEEESSRDPQKTKEFSTDSHKTEPTVKQQTFSVKEFLKNIDNLSLSVSSDSSRTRTDNIIAIDSESSVDMERTVPSVKDYLKRKTAAGTISSPKEKRPKVADATTVDAAKVKDNIPQAEVAKKKDTPTENPPPKKNTEVTSTRNQRSGSTEGPNKGVVIWQPKLLRVDQGISRPILSSDTVDDPSVAVGLSDIFLLPKDKGKIQDRSSSQIRELSLSHIGHMVNGVAELYRRCLNKDDLLNQAMKKEGMLKSELTKYAEKSKSSDKKVQEMEGKLERGSRLLQQSNDELVKFKNEARALSKDNSELKKQLEDAQKKIDEFPGKLEAEFNAGVDQAMDRATAEIPELMEEKWADGFKRAWSYALLMANTDPSSDLFNRCGEALDLTRSKIIGEQASVETDLFSRPPSPAIHVLATSEIVAPGLPPKAPVTESVKARETASGKEAQTETQTSNPPA